ncbi:MAG TPA: hypothetical protein VF377_06430 [Acidimicrobiia bacterium]|jgi:uncharacterized membrane protein YczE
MNLTLTRPSLRQFARYLVGIVVVSTGATLGIQSNLGAAPYDALLTMITDHTGLPFWVTAWVLQAMWITWILRAGGRFDIGTLLHSLSFGPIMSVMLGIVPEATTTFASVLYLIAAVTGMAMGLWLYLGAKFVAGMVDTLFETLMKRHGWHAGAVRTVFDLGCVAVAWIGAGPVGIGTVVLALGVGPILSALDAGLLRPATWRGIPLGRPKPVHLELVDTTEYPLLGIR